MLPISKATQKCLAVFLKCHNPQKNFSHRAAFWALPRAVLQWAEPGPGGESDSGGAQDGPPSLSGQAARQQQPLLGEEYRLHHHQH